LASREMAGMKKADEIAGRRILREHLPRGHDANWFIRLSTYEGEPEKAWEFFNDRNVKGPLTKAELAEVNEFISDLNTWTTKKDPLRSQTIRLAHEKPELRPYLLPLLKSASSIGGGWETVAKGSYLDEIWKMYEATYRKIGLSKASPSEMVSDYDAWEVLKKDEVPIAFVVSKKTPFGMKLGLMGSDGSPEGKSAIKTYLTRSFDVPGRYGEVSHAVEKIVMGVKPPVVCAAYVDKVIRKNVDPSADSIHYTRPLSGVGNVEKVLVGRPNGVETTDSARPSCPVESPDRTAMGDDGWNEGQPDKTDLDSHYACQIEL